MKVTTTIALGADVREALDEIAEREERSRSQICDRALRQWLSSRGESAEAPSSPPSIALCLPEQEQP
jgi:predicted transcriptional regulator